MNNLTCFTSFICDLINKITYLAAALGPVGVADTNRPFPAPAVFGKTEYHCTPRSYVFVL